MSPAAARRYTRVVEAFRLVLPGVAIALVASMALFWLMHDPDNSLKLNYTRIERLDDDLTMVNPTFQGTDAENRSYTVNARAARQVGKGGTTVELDTIDAVLTLPDQPAVKTLELEAAAGRLDTEASRLELAGGVRAEAGSGEVITMPQLAVDLDARTATSEGPVEATGPLGRIRADRLEITDGGRVIRFSGGVRTTIYPEGRKRLSAAGDGETEK
ncbi:MAG: LPS export ABC transporter periplasmic protein LptC [Alphaproteobacteria bacterium]|nr:LPS export ABC transporter periplasmic protein LptC [Alphaproteobacteria bacterium]